MGLLFVLIFWTLIFGILSILLGIFFIVLCHLIGKWKNVKPRLWACFFVPGAFIFCFAGLFFLENVIYGVVTDSGLGIGDYDSVNINSKYELYWIDMPNWRLGERDSGEMLSKHFANVQEILEHDDTIAFTSGTEKHYFMTQLNANKIEYATIDSASTTNELWDRYTKPRGIDKDDIYTCNEYYNRYRLPFGIVMLILNIGFCGFLLWKCRRFFIKEDKF